MCECGLKRGCRLWLVGPPTVAALHPPHLLPPCLPCPCSHTFGLILWELLTWGARPPGLVPAALALGRMEGREDLSRIEQPVLLLWGTRDLLVPLRVAYAYQRRLPMSELVVLNDTGHMLQMERPARFNWEVEEFVGRVTGGGPTQALLEPPDGR